MQAVLSAPDDECTYTLQVPGLFGVAGIIIGGLYCILDQVFVEDEFMRAFCVVRRMLLED